MNDNDRRLIEFLIQPDVGKQPKIDTFEPARFGVVDPTFKPSVSPPQGALIADARSGALDTAPVGLPERLPGFTQIERRLGVSDDFDAIGCK